MPDPQPLSDQQWADEVEEHQMQRMRANSERIKDMLDRAREEASWPEEIRRQRYRKKP